MTPFVQLHRAFTSEIAPDCEIWVNPAHVVFIEPHKVPDDEPSAIVQTTTTRIYTVESFAWVREQFTDNTDPDNAFGAKKRRKR